MQSTLSASLFSEPSSAAVSLPEFSSVSSVVSEKSSVVSEKSSVALEIFSSFSLAGMVSSDIGSISTNSVDDPFTRSVIPGDDSITATLARAAVILCHLRFFILSSFP